MDWIFNALFALAAFAAAAAVGYLGYEAYKFFTLSGEEVQILADKLREKGPKWQFELYVRLAKARGAVKKMMRQVFARSKDEEIIVTTRMVPWEELPEDLKQKLDAGVEIVERGRVDRQKMETMEMTYSVGHSGTSMDTTILDEETSHFPNPFGVRFVDALEDQSHETREELKAANTHSRRKMRADRIALKKNLCLAAAEGRVEELRSLLDQGDDSAGMVQAREKALIEAAKAGRASAVRLLLDRDVDIETSDVGSCTVSHWAARQGHDPVVKVLLDRQADLEANDFDGCTALIWASRAGRESVVRLLLARCPRLDAKDDYCRTALFHAAQKGHETIVKLLLDAGANSSVRDEQNMSPLDISKQKGHRRVVKLFLEPAKAHAFPSLNLAIVPGLENRG